MILVFHCFCAIKAEAGEVCCMFLAGFSSGLGSLLGRAVTPLEAHLYALHCASALLRRLLASHWFELVAEFIEGADPLFAVEILGMGLSRLLFAPTAGFECHFAHASLEPAMLQLGWSHALPTGEEICVSLKLFGLRRACDEAGSDFAMRAARAKRAIWRNSFARLHVLLSCEAHHLQLCCCETCCLDFDMSSDSMIEALGAARPCGGSKSFTFVQAPTAAAHRFVFVEKL